MVPVPGDRTPTGGYEVRALGVPGGHGVAIRSTAGTWQQDRPVEVWWTRSDAGEPHRIERPYSRLTVHGDGTVEAGATVPVPGSVPCELEVTDTWTAGPDGVRVRRTVRVRGDGEGGFATAVRLARVADGAGRPVAPHDWADVEPIVPGLVLGDATPVSAWTIGGPEARRGGVRHVLAREDRLSAPQFGVRYPDGAALVVHRDGGTRATVAADGRDRLVVDERIDLAALGGTAAEERVAVGAVYPAVEGEWTYTSGELPLSGLRGWRQTLHPLRDGLRHEVAIAWDTVHPASRIELLGTMRSAAWERLRPRVRRVAVRDHVLPVARVLSGQVRSSPDGVVGIGLESDPVTGRPVPGADASVMGFVGAATDVGYCLLRAADVARADESAPASDARHEASAARQEASRFVRQGGALLDGFSRLPIDPPLGEGIDLATGRPTTYRDLDGQPAVFLRAVAEGCHAALRAARYVDTRLAIGGRNLRPAPGDLTHGWRDWARAGGAFLVGTQRPDGSLPRAWRAGTDRVLQPSGTATATAVPFLVALSQDDPGLLEPAVRAGEFAWARAAEHLAYAGATLDNPDVVDKEAAVLAARGFLALHHRTGEDHWLDRALHAARVAESWVHLVDLPPPPDAPWADLHWKPGRSTVGLQLITSGVTMSDAFLVVDAALFVELTLLTGESWPARVARLVHHGAAAMLATVADPIDLAGPGWQQEHWSLGPRRGYGLNRHWLPWAAVATLDGYFRLRDLGPRAAELVGLDD